MGEERRADTQAPEDRAAVVLLHGFALDGRMWRRQVEALKTAYRVLVLDLPGFGPQAREVGEIEPAKEVARAMNAAKLERAHLVASSYGAAIAIDFALQFPHRVASLVLVGPMLLGRRMGIESWQRCIALANEGDQTTAAEVWLDDPLFESLRRDEILYDEVRQIVLDYAGGHWTGKVTSLWNERDPVSKLKDLEVPALVISGEDDLPSFKAMAEAYAKALPKVRHEVVPGSGHHVSLEAPEAFNALVRRFLEE
jgi:pimeloyl-ACP methyl ester carboxylesterase